MPSSSASSSPETRLAAALGVQTQDLASVGEIFAAAMARLGVDGGTIFRRLREGASLASALSVPPGAAPILYARAHSWFAIGRVDKAALLFRALCAIAGEVADHWVGYGVCLKKLGRLDEAERALTIAAERRPNWALPYFHLAETLLRLEEWGRAQAALAAYDLRADDGAPDAVRVEAERFRIALAVRARSGDAAGAGGRSLGD